MEVQHQVQRSQSCVSSILPGLLWFFYKSAVCSEGRVLTTNISVYVYLSPSLLPATRSKETLKSRKSNWSAFMSPFAFMEDLLCAKR